MFQSTAIACRGTASKCPVVCIPCPTVDSDDKYQEGAKGGGRRTFVDSATNKDVTKLYRRVVKATGRSNDPNVKGRFFLCLHHLGPECYDEKCRIDPAKARVLSLVGKSRSESC